MVRPAAQPAAQSPSKRPRPGNSCESAALKDKSVFVAASYREQYASDPKHCYRSLRELIASSGGKVVQFGKYDYIIVGDADKKCHEDGTRLTLAELHSLFAESGTSASAADTSGAKRQRVDEQAHRDNVALNELVDGFKRCASEQGASCAWQTEGHELIGLTMLHRHVDHVEGDDGKPVQFETKDGKQTMSSVAKKLGCNVKELCEVNTLRGVYGPLQPCSRLRKETYLLQPLVEILRARVVAVQDNQVALVDGSGAFVVQEDVLRTKKDADSCLLEADILDAWDDANAFFAEDDLGLSTGSVALESLRLSTGSSACSEASPSMRLSTGSGDSNAGSEIGELLSPASVTSDDAASEVGDTIDTHVDLDVDSSDIQIGMYIRRKFNVGPSGMPKLYTGRLMQRCGGRSKWCLVCKTAKKAGRTNCLCGIVRVVYTDTDVEDFNLTVKKDLTTLQGLLIGDAMVPAADRACPILQLSGA